MIRITIYQIDNGLDAYVSPEIDCDVELAEQQISGTLRGWHSFTEFTAKTGERVILPYELLKNSIIHIE